MFTQGCERRCELDVMLERFRGVDRELDDRDVGIGKCMDEHRPGAMVDPPAVSVDSDLSRSDETGDLICEIGITGCRVVMGKSRALDLTGRASLVKGWFAATVAPGVGAAREESE